MNAASVVDSAEAVPRWVFVLIFGALELLLGVLDRNAGVTYFVHMGGHGRRHARICILGNARTGAAPLIGPAAPYGGARCESATYGESTRTADAQ